MSSAAPTSVLVAVMYHYIRPAKRTRFQRLHAMALEDFTEQVDALRQACEMATLDSSLAFLNGRYRPKRPMCLLTFDDGLKEHLDIAHRLADHGIQGVFAITTRCIDKDYVLPVHKNHFLMADMDFETYRGRVLDALGAQGWQTPAMPDEKTLRARYRWDDLATAEFKYLFNYLVTAELREIVLNEIFTEHFGKEDDFARELYLSWEEARAMQEIGMVLAAHSHRHTAYALLDQEAARVDIATCTDLLKQNVHEQAIWPFVWPYGKQDSYTDTSVRLLKEAGYACALASHVGTNEPGADLFQLKRLDPKDVDSRYVAEVDAGET